MSDETQDAEFGLVMPMVVVTSKGGPYEDDAFVAGYIAGCIDQEMSQGDVQDRHVPTSLVPQIDLLAMHHGYMMLTEVYADAPEWSGVAFRKVEK